MSSCPLHYCPNRGIYHGRGTTKESEKILSKVANILNTNTFNMFFNTDARGYSLKFFENFSKDKPIHKDWGGYGIIAPDFREGL